MKSNDPDGSENKTVAEVESYVLKAEEATKFREGRHSMGSVYRNIYAKDGFQTLA